jgi:CRISPR-associated protein Cas1
MTEAHQKTGEVQPVPAASADRAKSLELGLSPSSVPDLVPARMINEVLYCERLMYLEWVQGEFQDNRFTVEGRSVHRRTDAERPLPPAENDPPYQARSVWLSSDRLGITGKIDVVDADEGRVLPVEYKRGKRPDLPDNAYLPERAQVCAQVLLLRDHGFQCDEAAIYYAGDHQRAAIRIDDDLIQTTLAAVERARRVAAGPIPPPLQDSPKCNGCSLVGICLPDEVSLLRSLTGEAQPEPSRADEPPCSPDQYGPLEPDPWDLAGPAPLPEPPELRRLHPARDDRVPLLVQEQGGSIALSGELLVVRRPGAHAVDARLSNTSQVCVFGNVQITTQALRALMDRGIVLSFFTYGGWFLGRAVGHDSKNVELKLAQYAASTSADTCLAMARRFVASKILNCRTLLRRNQREPTPVLLGELKQLARKAEAVDSPESLLGIEGSAARAYFSGFAEMLKDDGEIRSTFDFEGRNRRPPRDPINALLSFCYSMLTKDFAVTLAAVGLDPLLGFYHRPRFGRPALALDLMEEFRPIVADSVVIGAVNNETIQADDFVQSAGGVALKPAARKKLILAYERRMDQLVTHPVFGYRISYRRVLEVQARLLGRVLLGELDAYPSFRTR